MFVGVLELNVFCRSLCAELSGDNVQGFNVILILIIIIILIKFDELCGLWVGGEVVI